MGGEGSFLFIYVVVVVFAFVSGSCLFIYGDVVLFLLGGLVYLYMLLFCFC